MVFNRLPFLYPSSIHHKCPKQNVNHFVTYVFYCVLGCLTLLRIQFTVFVLIEFLSNQILMWHDKPISIKVIGRVWYFFHFPFVE